MKIRLAILESDTFYLNRIAAVFNTKYTDKLEIYSFTTEEGIFQALTDSRIDVLLASDVFKIDVRKLPSRCGFAYLVESADIESLWGEPALCKFQKAEMIYKQILNIFSEKAVAITGSGIFGGGRVVGFAGASGGSGCSTVAAAYTKYLAGKGKKAIYLNLEALGNADSYFCGEGQGNFSDIIYAVKSRKANLALKLESLARQDTTGAFFFSAPGTALDMLELKAEEIQQIILELKTSCKYDCVILDTDVQFGSGLLRVFENCDDVVLVSDGTETANGKIRRMVQALLLMEQQGAGHRRYDIGILYNRFSSRTSQKADDLNIREVGGIKRFEGYSAIQLSTKLSELDVFSALA